MGPQDQTNDVNASPHERTMNPGGGMTVSTQYRLCLWDVADWREKLRTEGEPDVLVREHPVYLSLGRRPAVASGARCR